MVDRPGIGGLRRHGTTCAACTDACTDARDTARGACGPSVRACAGRYRAETAWHADAQIKPHARGTAPPGR